MKKALYVLFFIHAFSCSVFSQIMPSENAQLHYRIIGFSFPATGHAQKYTLEIAKGMHLSETTFQKERFVKAEDSVNKIVAEVPSFGASYTWRVMTKTTAGNKVSPFYHFSTLPVDILNPNYVRLQIVEKATAYKSAYVFVDCARAMYDMNGQMVWFIPEHILPHQSFAAVEDMKLSPGGTITYLHEGCLWEITYDGKVLNRLPGQQIQPSAGFSSNIHHDACRLRNGHYMALGNEQIFWRWSGREILVRREPDTTGGYQAVMLATLDEYDEKGNVIWQYKASDYVLHSDITNWRTEDGKVRLDVHLNAFCFDERNNCIYLGFKNVSRIIKIGYPQGTTLSVYGKKCKEGDTDLDQELFCQQHAIGIGDGNIYVFNNNACGSNPLPKLVVLKEDNSEKYGLRKIWEYQYTAPVLLDGRNRGGNITSLTNGDVFASISMPYNGLLIVDQQKNTLWGARLERWSSAGNPGAEVGTYRASIVTAEDAIQNMVLYGH